MTANFKDIVLVLISALDKIKQLISSSISLM